MGNRGRARPATFGKRNLAIECRKWARSCPWILELGFAIADSCLNQCSNNSISERSVLLLRARHPSGTDFRDGAPFLLRHWVSFNLLSATSLLPNLFLQSAQPVVRASSLVRHGNNYNFVRLDGIEDVVWEVGKDSLANTARTI